MLEAIERMAANHLDALIVLSAQKLDGIITQEDYVREIAIQDRHPRETRVGEIMTRGVYYVNPDATIDECMLLMASRRVRHLPVMEGSTVISMLSIEDIVDWITDSQRVHASHTRAANQFTSCRTTE